MKKYLFVLVALILLLNLIEVKATAPDSSWALPDKYSGGSGGHGAGGDDGDGTGDASLCKRVLVNLDEDYKQKTEKERMFIPKEISPFDDIVCETKILNKKDAPPWRRTKGYISTNDGTKRNPDGTFNDTFVTDGWFECINCPLSDDELTQDQTYTYQMKIKGWPAGWPTSNDIMEELIKNKRFKCGVYEIIDDNGELRESCVQPLNLCVRLWGKDNAIKIANLRGKSADMSAKEIVSKGIEVMDNGFNSIDPFKTYKERFAHNADLTSYNDFAWESSDESGYVKFNDKYYTRIPLTSQCEGARIYNFFNGLTYAGYTKTNSKVNFINHRMLFRMETGSSIGAVHETGHAFCGLLDEYLYADAKKASAGFLGLFPFQGWKNCVKNPDVFGIYGDKTYGDGCDRFLNFSRPSLNSIMRFNNEPLGSNFNVISCGYCAKKIKGGSINSNWNNCMSLGAIKPVS